MAALLKGLAEAPSAISLVTLEDLWLEVQSQNVPGTSGERVNWKRKAKYSLEEIFASPEFKEILEGLQKSREWARKRR